MPKKILRRSRLQRNSLRLRTLQSDEPELFPIAAWRVVLTPHVFTSILTRLRSPLSRGADAGGVFPLPEPGGGKLGVLPDFEWIAARNSPSESGFRCVMGGKSGTDTFFAKHPKGGHRPKVGHGKRCLSPFSWTYPGGSQRRKVSIDEPERSAADC